MTCLFPLRDFDNPFHGGIRGAALEPHDVLFGSALVLVYPEAKVISLKAGIGNDAFPTLRGYCTVDFLELLDQAQGEILFAPRTWSN
jgi:hypothetical protein